MPLAYKVIILAGSSFAMNLPLGYLRQGCRKFSFLWFLYIHLSVPFIVSLRMIMDLSYWFIPLSVILAVAGQILGGRWRRPEEGAG